MIMTIYQSRHQSEKGSILLWLAISLTLVLSTLSFLYFNNTRLAAYTHLQAISEAAAIAGAQQLCPQDICLKNAYQAALTTITHNFSQQSKGYKKITILNSLPDEITGRQTFFSDNNDIEVTIYHGWTTREDPSSPNETFEEINSDWQSSNPGIPAQLVINTLRVEITLMGITNLFGMDIGSSSSTKIKSQATARSGPINEVPIAPFAIPACALINEEGVFNQGEICYGDRIFTRADRYLPYVTDFLPISVSYQEALKGIGPFTKPELGNQAEDYLSYYDYDTPEDAELKRQEAFAKNQFGIRPSFFYGPCSKDINECNIKRQINYSLDRDNINYHNEYLTFGGWTNYAYSHISDHFGVVGYTTKIHNESSIKLIINKINNIGVDAENKTIIGQSFHILRDGLKESYSGDLLWEIINKGSPSYFFGDLSKLNNETTMSSNRAMGLSALPNFPNLELLADRPLPYATFPATTVSASNQTESFLPTSKIFFNQARFENNDPEIINPNTYPTLLRDQFTNGLCQSRRVKLDCNGKDILNGEADASNCLTDPSKHFDSNEFNFTKQSEFISYTGQSFSLNSIPLDPKNNKVWKTKVPIIAEEGNNAKSCLGQDRSKPAINPKGNYIIIGYVDVDIFDLDIGSTIPTPSVAPGIQIHDTTPHTLAVATNNPDINNPDYHDYHLSHHPESTNLKIPEIAKAKDVTGQPLQSRGPNPWHFQINEEPTACNLVRARIACDNNFISSSQNHGPRRAVLINPKKL